MKQTKFYIIIAIIGLLTSIFFFNSCQKEDDNLQSQPNLTLKSGEFSYKLTTTVSYSNIQLVNGLLAFKDMQTFKATLNSLERQAAEWDDAFVQRYALSDKDKFSENNIEELNNKEEKIGFNDKQPLINFEKYFGFNSLREKIAQEEEDWLNHEKLDFNNDPEDIFIENEYLRTVVNNKSEIMIGNSIYKILDNGLIYEITDGDFSKLNKIQNYIRSSKYSFKENNIIIHNNDVLTKSNNCRSNASRKLFYNYATNRLVKCKISLKNYPWKHRAVAKTVSYKRKRRRWRKYRTRVKVRVFGYVSDSSNCSNNTYISSSTNSKKRKKIKAHVGLGHRVWVKKNWLTSYHYCNGWSKYIYLKW